MKKQNGFTLIELVVVMVILGIMAAVALPKFVNMTGQARMAKMQGAVGAVQSSITLIHAKWLAMGSPSSGDLEYEGGKLDIATEMKNGYPMQATFKAIAGLDSSFDTTTTVGTISDNEKKSCYFKVADSTGAGIPPVLDTTNVTETTCQ